MTDDVPTPRLGGELPVGRIGFGAMRLTGPDLFGDLPDREAGLRLLREVVAAGTTMIDTADVYGPHTNEQLIHDALHPYPEDLVVATKGGFVRGGRELSTITAVGTRNYLRQSAYLSARRLGVESIDLYYLHSPYATDASFEDQVGTLTELRQEGLIRHIGLSNVSTHELQVARGITEIAAVTAHFNVADRRNRELLDATVDGGAVFVPWQPVSLTAPGAATDTAGPARLRRVLGPIAERHGVGVPQVALAWLLSLDPNVLPIPATTSGAHLRQNLAAGSLVLDPDELAAVEGAAGTED